MLLDALFSRSFDLGTVIASIVSSLIVIFVCLPFHEFAHAFVANKMGDPTGRHMGRLTVNPLAHIDWVGAAMILLVGFGYAKPVQVNQYNLRKPKRDMAIIAIAGPVANILMAFILLLLSNIIGLIGQFISAMWLLKVLSFVVLVLYYAALINVSLAVFNLIPIPPLDGSRVLFAFAPDRIYYAIQKYEQYIIIGVFVLILSGSLDVPLSFATNGVFSAVSWVADLPFKLIYSII